MAAWIEVDDGNYSDWSNALTSADTEGRGVIVATGEHSIDMTLTWDAKKPLTILAHSAEIAFTGTGPLFDISKSSTHPADPMIHVEGGYWIGNSGADCCWKLTDAGNVRFRDLKAYGWSNASGYGVWWIRNYAVWSENQSFTGIKVGDSKRVATYQGADDTGGTGTSSFARQRWHDISVSQGDDYWWYLDDNAGAYDSWWSMIGGNASTSLEAVFRIVAAGASTIDGVKIEGGAESGSASYPTALIDDAGAGNKPNVINCDLRDSIVMVKNGTLDEIAPTRVAQGVSIRGNGDDEAASIVTPGPTITGARSTGQALDDLISELDSLGLIDDQTDV